MFFFSHFVFVLAKQRQNNHRNVCVMRDRRATRVRKMEIYSHRYGVHYYLNENPMGKRGKVRSTDRWWQVQIGMGKKKRENLQSRAERYSSCILILHTTFHRAPSVNSWPVDHAFDCNFRRIVDCEKTRPLVSWPLLYVLLMSSF